MQHVWTYECWLYLCRDVSSEACPLWTLLIFDLLALPPDDNQPGDLSLPRSFFPEGLGQHSPQRQRWRSLEHGYIWKADF